MDHKFRIKDRDGNVINKEFTLLDMLDLLKRVIETSKNQPNMDFVEVELSGVEPPVSMHFDDFRD